MRVILLLTSRISPSTLSMSSCTLASADAAGGAATTEEGAIGADEAICTGDKDSEPRRCMQSPLY
jgi:hypothetical protein